MRCWSCRSTRAYAKLMPHHVVYRLPLRCGLVSIASAQRQYSQAQHLPPQKIYRGLNNFLYYFGGSFLQLFYNILQNSIPNIKAPILQALLCPSGRLGQRECRRAVGCGHQGYGLAKAIASKSFKQRPPRSEHDFPTCCLFILGGLYFLWRGLISMM